MARNYAITERRAEPMNVKGVQIEFYFLDKRGRDLTNMAESIMDLLVDCQILVDDKWQCTGPVHLIPCGIDKINPRAEVTLFMMWKKNFQKSFDKPYFFMQFLNCSKSQDMRAKAGDN